MPVISTSPAETEARLRQLQQEQAQLEQQLKVQQFAANYETQWSFPAIVQGAKKTNTDLLQHRLLEAGLLYEVPVTVGESVAAMSRFVEDLEASECFNAVQVKLGGIHSAVTPDNTKDQENSDEEPTEQKVTIILDEKKWYKLYLGGGLKRDALSSSSSLLSTADNSFLPTAQLEAMIGLRNIAGFLDKTDFNYSVDTHNRTTCSLQHSRPLYTVLPERFGDELLTMENGSQYEFQSQAVWDTLDWESTRSFNEVQRFISFKAKDVWSSLEWKLNWRDVVPRRHSTLPYQFAASPEVLSQAGPSVKHSLTARFNSPKSADEEGVDYILETELALPPGDVGFVKSQAHVAWHVPLVRDIKWHSMASVGVLSDLSFVGICGKSHLSDRFLLGGPLNFRGFSPAGIGPRATNGKVGDALGGNFVYKVTGMLSAPVPVSMPLRVFGFGTVGTCAHVQKGVTASQILASSRASVGVGLATNMLGPRLEFSYAVPLRYGPRDHRRNFQFGIGFAVDG